MERNDHLIRKKIYKYLFTSVLTTVALQLGNVVDAMIVGNLIGSSANAAVSAGTPFVYLLQVAAFLMGMGGAVTIAVLLGERDTDNAGRVMGVSLLASFVYPLIFTLLTPVTVPAYIHLMGLNGEQAEMVRQIITVYSLGMPVCSVVIAMTNMISVDNHPTLSSAMLITANVINLTCDVLLVKFTPLGLIGSTMSTIIGYLKSKDRMVKPSLKGLKEHIGVIGLTCKNGLPNTMYLVMNVIKVFALNKAVVEILGDDMLPVFAVANNTQQITQMFLNGITAVIASVAGVLFGEKDYFGMRSVLHRVLVSGLSIGGIVTVLFLIAPQILASLYGFRDPVLLPLLLRVLRIFALSFIFYVLNCIVQNYYKVIGLTALSTLDSMLELVLLCIPLSAAGMRIFGIEGLFGALIVNELLTFAVINLIRLVMYRQGKIQNSGFMAIPHDNEGSICDISIQGSDASAVGASKEIERYCRENGIDDERSALLRLATEEIVANIAEYGYKAGSEKLIDICLSKADGKIYLRFRDDGIPFDPTSYTPEDDETHGLDLLKKLTLSMTYMRVIDLNNTIFELDMRGNSK